MADDVEIPTRQELIDALRVMTYAYDAKTTRDGLRYIGLGHLSTFPGMLKTSKIASTDDARMVLVRHERARGAEQSANRLMAEMYEADEAKS